MTRPRRALVPHAPSNRKYDEVKIFRRYAAQTIRREARDQVMGALHRHRSQLWVAGVVVIGIYVAVLASTQWFHLEGHLAEHVFHSDRGAGVPGSRPNYGLRIRSP